MWHYIEKMILRLLGFFDPPIIIMRWHHFSKMANAFNDQMGHIYPTIWPSIVEAKSIAARFLRSRPRPRSYSSPLSGTVGYHHPWSQLSGSTNGDPLRSWSCCAFFPYFFLPLLKFYGFVCSNLGSLRFYSMVLLTCLEQQLFPIQTFFFLRYPHQTHLRWIWESRARSSWSSRSSSGAQSTGSSQVAAWSQPKHLEGKVRRLFFFVSLDLQRWTWIHRI